MQFRIIITKSIRRLGHMVTVHTTLLWKITTRNCLKNKNEKMGKKKCPWFFKHSSPSPSYSFQRLQHNNAVSSDHLLGERKKDLFNSEFCTYNTETSVDGHYAWSLLSQNFDRN